MSTVVSIETYRLAKCDVLDYEVERLLHYIPEPDFIEIRVIKRVPDEEPV